MTLSCYGGASRIRGSFAPGEKCLGRFTSFRLFAILLRYLKIDGSSLFVGCCGPEDNQVWPKLDTIGAAVLKVYVPQNPETQEVLIVLTVLWCGLFCQGYLYPRPTTRLEQAELRGPGRGKVAA